MIKILKGDDTDAMGNMLKISINVPGLDLAGCKLELSFLGVKHVMPCEKTNTFLLVLSAKETASMPLGVTLATVRLIDRQERRLTLTNTLKIKITDCVSEAYGRPATISDISITIPPLLAGTTYDLGGTNGDTRAFIARLAEALGATVVNTEEES